MTESEWKAMALRVLRHVEWRGWDRYEEFCAKCGRWPEEGHEPDCELGLLLAEADTADCVALQALYNIRHLAIRAGDPGVILRKISVEAVDVCDLIMGRFTSIEDRPFRPTEREAG